jgi:hypothetical protein
METAPKRVAWGLGLVALALYAALPMGRMFSDGAFLIDLVTAGPAPYYNVAYVPVGYALHAALEPLFGWSVETALTLLSAVLMAAGVVGTLRLGGKLGIGPGPLFVAGLLLVFSPGALFFGGVVEVHPMQFAGAVWALGIAWDAGARHGAAAWRLLALACLVAFLAHLSHALMLPGLWLLARRGGAPGGEPTGCRLGRRGLPWIAIGVVVSATLWIYCSSRDFASWSRRSHLVWISALWVFARNLVLNSYDRGLYSVREMGEYLSDEFILQAVLLVAGLVVGAFAWLRHFISRRFDTPAGEFTARAFPMILPALLIFAQGGIFEHGAYYLTYYPVLALALAWALDSARPLRARAWPAWLVLAVVVSIPQLGLALHGRSEFRDSRLDAREWLAAIDSELAAGDSVVTTSLAREYEIEVRRPDLAVADFNRRLTSMPMWGHSDLLARELAIAMAPLAGPRGAGHSLWIDREIFERRHSGPTEAWREELRKWLEHPAVRVEEVHFPGAELLRVQLAQ